GSTVTVGAIPVGLNSLTPTTFTFTTPQGVPCNAAIVVTNPDTQTANTPFNPSPVITTLINAQGPVAGGGTTFIIGSQYLPGTTVTIGGSPATIQYLSPLTMLVGVPPGAMPGLVPIVVSSATGCSATASYLYQ